MGVLLRGLVSDCGKDFKVFYLILTISAVVGRCALCVQRPEGCASSVIRIPIAALVFLFGMDWYRHLKCSESAMLLPDAWDFIEYGCEVFFLALVDINSSASW